MTATIAKSTIVTNSTTRKLAAILPAPLLYAAAQFTSKDEGKGSIQFVSIRAFSNCNEQYLEIASTDGHRCFRVNFQANDYYFAYCDAMRENENGATGHTLLIKPDALRKKVAYAHSVQIYSDGYCEFIGGKAGRYTQELPTEFLSGVNCSSHPYETAQFPNIGQLWPDFINPMGTDEPIAFNANYVAEFCKIVAMVTPNFAVTMHRNSRISPFALTAKAEILNLENVTIGYLVMPIQVRE